MPTTDTAKLYGHWLALWNGDLTYAKEIIAPDCVVHDATTQGTAADQRSGPERTSALVTQRRAPFQRLVLTLDVGPIEEGDKLAARWTARGTLAGGADPAALVEFSGIDLCRIANGKIAEYWVSSDAQHAMTHAGNAAKTPSRR